jgi:transposase-like protein
VETLGITRLSRSQVSEMARDLDEQVEAFRTRPLDAGPYTFVGADALVLKVREGGRVVNVHALLAAGVNADGHREIFGLQVTSAEDGAGSLGFFRDLTARGLTGVALVTSDAHRGLVEAIGATLPGASWQRCCTHYAANLMAATPKASWPWVKTLLPAGGEDPARLADRCGGAGDGAQRRRAGHGVERGVIEWHVLGVRLAQGHVPAEACAALPGDGQHRWAELDAGTR